MQINMISGCGFRFSGFVCDLEIKKLNSHILNMNAFQLHNYDMISRILRITIPKNKLQYSFALYY